MERRRNQTWSVRSTALPGFWVFTTCLAGIGVTLPAQGDGYVQDAHTAVSGGRGGTNFAFADTGVTLLQNPGGMVNIASPAAFDASLTLIIADQEYSDPQNDSVGGFSYPENPSTPFHGAFIQRADNRAWALGFGVFTPAGFGSYSEQTTTFAGTQTYRSLAVLVKSMPGFAVRINDSLSVGGALGLGASYAELEGPFFFQTGALAGTPALIEVDAIGLAPAWSVGLQYQLSESTTLGLAYTGETRFRLEGDAEAEIFGLAPLPVRSRFELEMDLVYPRSLGFGVLQRIGNRHRLGLDVEWFDWSSAADRIDLRLFNPSNPMFAGSAITDRIALDWKDTISLRVGYEYDLTERQTLRAGYIYHESPSPPSTLISYVPAVTEHLFTVGYTHRSGPWSFDLAYIFGFGDGDVGASDLTGGDFSRSSFDSNLHILVFGLRHGF